MYAMPPESPPRIHPTACIEAGAELAEGVSIGPFCHVGAKAALKSGVILDAHSVVLGRTSIGEGCRVHSFAVLGGPPQHLGYKGQDTTLVIGANNIIREHVTMNIGTIEGRSETLVGNNNMFMTGAHVGHDCVVGDHTVFANNATLGGHVIIEDHVFLGGLCGVHQHCQIGAHAFLGGAAAVIHDVVPFGSANGNYAVLKGLNIIGLKRRGFSDDAINAIRAAYKLLFTGKGIFRERLAAGADQFGDNIEAMVMIDFITRERARPLMMAG